MRREKYLAPSFTIFLMILTLIKLSPSLALQYGFFNGYQVKDLTSTDLEAFAFETQGWTVSGLNSSRNSSLCGPNNPILAGYGTFNNSLGLSKTYSALPTHNALYFQITFSFIDRFKTPDDFTLALDSTSIAGGGSLKTYNSYLTSNICGGSDADTTQFMITGSLPHTANTLAFHLTAKASTGSGSGTLGIRDIQFTFVNGSSITSSTSCFRIYDTQLFSLSGECPCVKGSYYNAGSCSTCHPSCIDCSGPSAGQCYACATGYSWNGTQCIKCDSSCLTCTGPGSLQCVTCKDGFWLQANGSCTANCDLPSFATQVVGSLQVCYSGCTASQYTLWDRSCADNCSFPLVASTVGSYQLCDQPCQTGESLYWNGSCITGCPAPLVSSNLNRVLICRKPCLTNEFLYQNGSCLSTCSLPYLESSLFDVDLCQSPCASSSQFLYPNGSCLTQCQSPLVSSTTDGVKECSSPCANSSDYYYTANNSCGASCLSPNTLESVEFLKVCLTPMKTGDLSSEDKKFVDQAKTVTEATGKTTAVGVIISSLLSPHGANAITLVSLVKMLEYIRYIDVDYPKKVQYMLDSEKKSSISLNLEVEFPENVQEKFPNYPVPAKFGEYHLKSSFILNYSKAIFTFAVLLTILGVSMVLAPLLKNVKYLGVVCGKIRDIIKWNFFLIVLCENIESVGVYSSLEFRTTHFNSFISVFGTLVCCLVNLLILYLILLVPYIIYSLRRKRSKVLPLTKDTVKSEKDNSDGFESCGVLFMNFKDKSVWQHLCMFFVLIRVYLFYLIIGYLFEYPLTQAILITLMSVIMLGYLSISRAFRNKLELLKNITYESIIALVNLCVLILTIVEHKNIGDQRIKNRLGDAIIMANTIFNIMALLFLVAEIIIKLIRAYKARKTIKEKGLKYWAKIATILLEPEEMEHHHQDNHHLADNAKPETPFASAPGKAVVFKQQRLDQADSIFDSQILDMRRPNSPSLIRAASNKSQLSPNQSISPLNGFLSSRRNTMNLLHPRVPESQSRPNSYRTLLSSSQVSLQEFELQKAGNESSLSQMNGDQGRYSGKSRFLDVLYESTKENKRTINKRRTFLAANENLIDSSFEGGISTPKGRPLVISPRNLKTSRRSGFKPRSQNI